MTAGFFNRRSRPIWVIRQKATEAGGCAVNHSRAGTWCMWPSEASAIHTLTSGSEMVTGEYFVYIPARHGLDRASFGSCDERQSDVNGGL
jgi:hypothetical protein